MMIDLRVKETLAKQFEIEEQDEYETGDFTDYSDVTNENSETQSITGKSFDALQEGSNDEIDDAIASYYNND